MSLLAFQLAGLYSDGSLADGAKLAGAATLTAGVIGPWRGAQLDKHEMRRGLQTCCCMAGFGVVIFAVAVYFRSPFWLLLLSAGSVGGSTGGIWGGFRALLQNSVPEQSVRRAHFVESLSTELGYLLGPLVVTAIVAVLSIVAGLVLMAVLFVVAALALIRVHELQPPESKKERVTLSRQIVYICGLAGFVSLSLGLTEGNIPSRMGEYRLPPADAGLFLVLLSVGSVVGGLIVSVRPIKSRRAARRASVLSLLFAASIVPSSLAQSSWLFGLSLLFVTLSYVPLSGLGAWEVENRLGSADRGRTFAAVCRRATGGRRSRRGAQWRVAVGLACREDSVVASSLLLVLAIALCIWSITGERNLDPVAGQSGS